MEYSVKAIQYIRKRSDPGKWMPVDTILITVKVPAFNPEDDPALLHKFIKVATQKLLGKNWMPAHYEKNNAVS